MCLQAPVRVSCQREVGGRRRTSPLLAPLCLSPILVCHTITPTMPTKGSACLSAWATHSKNWMSSRKTPHFWRRTAGRSRTPYTVTRRSPCWTAATFRSVDYFFRRIPEAVLARLPRSIKQLSDIEKNWPASIYSLVNQVPWVYSHNTSLRSTITLVSVNSLVLIRLQDSPKWTDVAWLCPAMWFPCCLNKKSSQYSNQPTYLHYRPRLQLWCVSENFCFLTQENLLPLYDLQYSFLWVTFCGKTEDELSGQLEYVRESAKRMGMHWAHRRACFLLGRLCAKKLKFSQVWASIKLY